VVGTSVVAEPTACLQLLASLPLNADPNQQSIYQNMVQEYTTSQTVGEMTLATLVEAIHQTWYARFGNVSPKSRPKAGTFYLQKGDKSFAPKKPQQQNVAVAQKTSAVKEKGPSNLRLGTSAPAGDPDPYPQVF